MNMDDQVRNQVSYQIMSYGWKQRQDQMNDTVTELVRVQLCVAIWDPVRMQLRDHVQMELDKLNEHG
jgi:hypothetical protein